MAATIVYKNLSKFLSNRSIVIRLLEGYLALFIQISNLTITIYIDMLIHFNSCIYLHLNLFTFYIFIILQGISVSVISFYYLQLAKVFVFIH